MSRFLPGFLRPLLGVLIATSPMKGHGADGNFDYDQIAAEGFWQSLYPDGGWTLYCGFRFGPDRRTTNGRAVILDHVYPVERILEAAGCESRMECRDRNDERFMRMEADMHNLYPVWQPLVLFRAGREFGMIRDALKRFDDCDIRWQDGIVEPRQVVRGNIARSILYMFYTYHVPLTADFLEMLKRWNRDDPPSDEEKRRNGEIQKLQGKRNPFIDRPALADSLKTP